MRIFQKSTSIKTKKGATSIYIVAFTTMVLSILTISFVRIMVSEAQQTSNYDLSQSAYDSALAGIEDAKVALLKYHQCLSNGTTSGSLSAPKGTCSYIVAAMQNGIREQSCDTVADVLNRPKGDGGEVMVQETNSTSDNKSTVLDQAYTCVTIEEELDDYRAYLNADNRTRIIPVRTDSVADINGVYFQWYSDSNGSGNNMMGTTLKANNLSNSYAPPLVTFEFIQTDMTFSLGELSVNNGTSGKGTDHALLVLNPVATGGTNSIDSGRVLDVSDKSDNTPINVNCGSSSNAAGFYCGTYIQLPPTYNGNTGANRNPNTFFFRVTLPYGTPATDFSISLCTSDGCAASVSGGGSNNTRSFTAVQARVDSTGRANDLYRRVETRIELVDTGFPYPEFVIEVSDALEKNFWVTKNCWLVQNGSSSTCGNSGSV